MAFYIFVFGGRKMEFVSSYAAFILIMIIFIFMNLVRKK